MDARRFAMHSSEPSVGACSGNEVPLTNALTEDDRASFLHMMKTLNSRWPQQQLTKNTRGHMCPRAAYPAAAASAAVRQARAMTVSTGLAPPLVTCRLASAT